ncbi:MAG: NFACT RNA binding domain-containing protein [Lachnospiraceae bacterium]|jgi:predicted ribosome quality control (RQC) complex YloA/Tae2 family protein
MAFDGFTTAALTKEFRDLLVGARIYRIIQPEQDELLITFKPMMEKGGGTVRLCLCADPTLPLAYLTDENRTAPASAPTFCMLLRKYLQNGKVTAVEQPGLERIIRFQIEHLNEMGDLCHHTLVLELMGKHSNLILLDENEVITDSIRRISSLVSSVREVLPGRPYFVPETQNKRNPFEETKEAFDSALKGCGTTPAKFLVSTYTGFSNVISQECVHRTHLGQDRSCAELDEKERSAFFEVFSSMLSDVKNGAFSPAIYYHLGSADVIAQGEPVEFSALPMTMYRDLPKKDYDSMSRLVRDFYAQKNIVTRIRQKSQDLRHIVSTILERDIHKYDLQQKQLKDTKKREQYRIYGELLNAYGYGIPSGAKSAVLDNYYTGEKLTVPLDPTKTAQQNAKHYFDRYTKMKRTEEELSKITADVKAEIDELEGIRHALDLATTEGDLKQIRSEMQDVGFVHKKQDKNDRRTSGKTAPSKPLHFVSTNGFDLFVGKNNTQNDDLTFHFSSPSDIWFHANDMPGSHVILRTAGKAFEDIPDADFEDAARLAAYYSSGARNNPGGRIEVDYLERRGVKKPSGARPGFVIYHSNFSINVLASITGIREVKD